MNENQFAKHFDHTNLKPNATDDAIKQLCTEAKQYNFTSVCVNPGKISLAVSILKDSEVKICTVIGFPLGDTFPAVKIKETEEALKAGATEFDMVINIGALKDQNYEYIKQDIQGVVNAANGNITKVILETCYLTDAEIRMACKLVQKAGADFVKTSTGFGSAGATAEHIRIMREEVGINMGVKASGGIRSYANVKEMLDAGANRIGASSSVKILEEFKKK